MAGIPHCRRGSLRTLATLGLLAATVCAVCVALGTWQLQRRVWKLDLIARVEARIRAEPATAPAPDDLPAPTRASDEYRRVRAEGVFLHARETLVQAVTDRGPGFWVVTPLRRADGTTILINRGFVPPDRRAPASREPGPDEARVTGLLRLSEPGGAFLRANDPVAERWYSRDVAAIAAARGLTLVAPYFVDADAKPNPGGLPVGGLTVVAFRNDHLVYAVTWYVLALMAAGGGWIVLREARRRHERSEPSSD